MKSLESVTGGRDPDVGMIGGQAFDRAWGGVREPRYILMAHETKFQSRTLSLGVSPKYEIDFTQPSKPVENTFQRSLCQIIEQGPPRTAVH